MRRPARVSNHAPEDYGEPLPNKVILRKFGAEPQMKNLPSERRAPNELYILDINTWGAE